MRMNEKILTKLIIAGIITLFAVVVIGNSCTVVGPTEKGVVVTLGQVKGVVSLGVVGRERAESTNACGGPRSSMKQEVRSTIETLVS